MLELIKRIQECNPDDIYLGEYSGWYCQNEETLVPERQVRDKKDEDGHPDQQPIVTPIVFGPTV